MTTPPSDFESRWDKLVQRARADRPPEIDSSALFEALRQDALLPRRDWLGDFAALFGRGRLAPACLVASGALALVLLWQVMQWWELLPWAEFLGATMGGAI